MSHGYSRLVAGDGRNAAAAAGHIARSWMSFIAKIRWSHFQHSGRCDVLAEFARVPSKAVRCAIDIQESLRTRNRAYPLQLGR